MIFLCVNTNVMHKTQAAVKRSVAYTAYALHMPTCLLNDEDTLIAERSGAKRSMRSRSDSTTRVLLLRRQRAQMRMRTRPQSRVRKQRRRPRRHAARARRRRRAVGWAGLGDGRAAAAARRAGESDVALQPARRRARRLQLHRQWGTLRRRRTWKLRCLRKDTEGNQ